MVQGELFRENLGNDLGDRLEIKRSFLSKTVVSISLDKLIMAAVGLTVLFALLYSFGVEQGKRAMEQKLESFMPVHGDTLLQKKPSEEVLKAEEIVLVVGEEAMKEPPGVQVALEETATEVIEVAKPGEKRLPLADLKRGSDYTVQLVTYMTEEKAEEEIRRLSTKGHQSFAIPSGNYYQVCVDYFKNKREAKETLLKLQTQGRYPDAYIRTVVR